MEKITYGNWPNCYRLSNGLIDLIVTGDVGPRIIHFGYTGKENEFVTFPEQLGLTGGNQWHSYGGHRFWAAPEALPRTYHPDNDPVDCREVDGFFRATAPVESTTLLQKEIDIWVEPHAAHVCVTHRLKNASLWPITLAPWALSVMAAGGTGILPLPEYGRHGVPNLLPKTALAMWAYTDLSDPRFKIGARYLLLSQSDHTVEPQKIGASVPAGWTGYVRQGHFFLVKTAFQPQAVYPDANSSVEFFTNEAIFEVETLGPTVELQPGASVEHVEDWYLFDQVPSPTCDDDVKQHILPLVRSV
ncbi:MAG TPA: hypothetical protein PKW33_02995 [Anaerolineaceae bacterium]|nr:hypothetical protein [Anaerolineaceae bacterium]HPN50528.1 hypothetical protein [Anaerolineaceae bacterium]